MQKLEFDWEMNIPIYQYRGWDKSPSLDIFLDCRARRSG